MEHAYKVMGIVMYAFMRSNMNEGFVQTSWNESGHRMAASSADGSIQVWDANADSAQGLKLTAKWKVISLSVFARAGKCFYSYIWKSYLPPSLSR